MLTNRCIRAGAYIHNSQFDVNTTTFATCIYVYFCCDTAGISLLRSPMAPPPVGAVPSVIATKETPHVHFVNTDMTVPKDWRCIYLSQKYFDMSPNKTKPVLYRVIDDM